MRISLRWLSRHVDLDDKTPQQLLDDLTMSTAEVDAVEHVGAGLDRIVVGHVVECMRHPDADKLSLTRVDVGAGEAVGIVCGAPNVRAGQKVAVALPGVTLPDGTKLKKTKIRGAESAGMICSERELGLSEAHEGIMVLGEGARAGTRLLDVLPLEDHVLVVDNKSINHRPDLWGHRGFARELAAIYGRPLRPLPEPPALPATGETLAVAIEDQEGCPRFTGLLVKGVRVADSPEWLRCLLRAVGSRPINNVVDLTNFVMADLGQPMHAFDRRFLAPDGVQVRRARDGEALTTLDGVERKLTAQDLVVASGGRPVALAGVMGGSLSMVGPHTTELFVESASFQPAAVRRTSVRLALRTDASARFEKSLDPAGAEVAQHELLALLREACPDAHAAGPLVDPSRWRYAPRSIELRRARLDMKLGVTLPRERVEHILGALQFDLHPTASGWSVGVPSFRATKDVTIEDDLIEEVGRMFRYDNVPPVPLEAVLAPPHREPELWLARTVLRLGAAELGCNEVYNYSFVPDAVLAACQVEAHAYETVSNPVAPEVARVRRHVMPSLLSTVAPNLRERAEVRLMEHGKGYHPEERDEAGLPREVAEIAFAWSRNGGEAPYPELRSGLEAVLRRVGCPVELDALAQAGERRWLHPGKTVSARRGGREVGYVGLLHPVVARNLALPPTTAIASIDLRGLLATPRERTTMAPLPRFPSQPVDVALVVPSTTTVKTVADFLRRAGGKLVRDLRLFEVYRGERIAAGAKSLNFTVVLGADDRTLTSLDEEKFIARVREKCGEIGAELRG
jgi:phenylalanyl-tRNA synthetase beta chain